MTGDFMWRYVLFFFLIVCSNQSASQTNQLFNYNNGLSNSLVNHVYQDRYGFIWVATEDGLNRFDGQRFKKYVHQENNPKSLKSNFVKVCGEDKDGNLWVGYNYGIQKYNYSDDTFTDIEFYSSGIRVYPNIAHFELTKTGTVWLSSSGKGVFYIEDETKTPIFPERLNELISGVYHDYIFEDKDGILWISSENSGLSSYNPSSGEVRNYPVVDNSGQPSLLYISSICEDDLHNIYIGTLKNGLYKLSKKTDTIEKVKSEKTNEHFLQVKSLLFDSKKRLWVGTDGKGLRILNNQSGELEEFVPNTTPFDFSKSKIHSIIEDNSGNIWLGIFQKGLFLLPESKEMFKHYGYKPFGNQSIGSSCIMSIASDEKYIWAGTDGDGVYQLSREGKKLDHILLEDLKGGYSGNNILSINDSGDGYLWIGTFLNGLVRLNKKSKEFKVYQNKFDDNYSLPNDKVSCIANGESDTLWLGTMGNGVVRYDYKTNRFYREFNEPSNNYSLLNDWVNDIYIENKNRFWIATFGGLTMFEPDKGKATHFLAADGFLPNDVVHCLKPDSKGNLWIGTDNGLVMLNQQRERAKLYQVQNGLPSNVICAIEEDEYNQIWVSTHNGLAKLNPRNGLIISYYDFDGIQANEFSRKASCKGISNEIYFGGINGITEIVNKKEEPLEAMKDIILTDFILFDESVEIGYKSGKYIVLKKSILVADTIQLSSKDNAFSIVFTTMEFANRARVDYEYLMEGLDKTWKTAGAVNNRATYTNLDPGHYKFKVRGVDGGKVSPTRVLTIIIHPPWYSSTVAIIAWSLIGILLLYWLFLFFKGRIRHHQAERLNEMKMQFFINISHEIKTPLSLILDPLEKLMKKNEDPSSKKLYQIMYKNASRIFRLINQLLDVRKHDKNQLLFKYQKVNITQFIKDVSESYKLLAIDKSIQFNINSKDENINVWIDPLNFEKVIFNLLSNAFKFTQTNGQIEVEISNVIRKLGKKEKNKYAEIIVKDTGIGIKESEIENVFKRFYQIDSKETRFNTGAGIGLHLAMSMVKKHKGHIYAENRNDCRGSKFVVLLPLGNEHLPKDDLIIEENILPVPINSINKSYNVVSEKIPVKSKKNDKELKLMIVDDEEDIRLYLASQLIDEYEVELFSNGKEAWEALKNYKPDLIISDILMPEMDGISFCKKVKGTITTSHIPVVLLTALSKEEDKAEGIETGADMYLTKPFNTNLLKKIVANLIGNRKRLIKKLSESQEITNIANVELKSHDEILIQKVMTIIKENISDSSLNVETLADGIGLSRVHMHRKLKELTNQSARDFIKNIRMKQAAYLLSNKKVNVSEIAYAVGFSNPSHFSTTFKSFYGISPKEYAENKLGD